MYREREMCYNYHVLFIIWREPPPETLLDVCMACTGVYSVVCMLDRMLDGCMYGTSRYDTDVCMQVLHY